MKRNIVTGEQPEQVRVTPLHISLSLFLLRRKGSWGGPGPWPQSLMNVTSRWMIRGDMLAWFGWRLSRRDGARGDPPGNAMIVHCSVNQGGT